jgi:hypothetical protein
MSTNAVSNLNGRGGRPLGVRNRLTNKLVTDLSEIWHQEGPKILQKMAQRHPDQLARMAYATLPKDILVSVEQRIPGGLSPEDWALLQQVLDLIRDNMPAGINAAPAEVLNVIAMALRIHYAKPVAGGAVWDGVSGIGKLGKN